MSTKLIIALVVIIVAVLGGYFLLSNKTKVPYSTQISPSPRITEKESNQISPTGVSIVINEQNNSGESGIAIIREVNGKVNINLKLIGAGASSQPVHLHLGTCEKPGKVVYSLTNVVNGESKTVLEVNMTTFNKNLPLILNVHKSEQELGIYLSCGEVSSK